MTESPQLNQFNQLKEPFELIETHPAQETIEIEGNYHRVFGDYLNLWVNPHLKIDVTRDQILEALEKMDRVKGKVYKTYKDANGLKFRQIVEA